MTKNNWMEKAYNKEMSPEEMAWRLRQLRDVASTYTIDYEETPKNAIYTAECQECGQKFSYVIDEEYVSVCMACCLLDRFLTEYKSPKPSVHRVFVKNDCETCMAGNPVPHDPSETCKSGKHRHCTCDWCF